MTPAEWLRVRELFEGVVDLSPADAARRLDTARGVEPAVAAEVESLLAHHSRSGRFLEQPPLLPVDAGPELSPGDSVGPYVVEREIGRGGMGRVYVATDTRLGRKVSLKSIHPDLSSDPSYRERLRREARIAASLTHPAICAVYALEEIEGHLLLVTELIDGETLRREIERGPLATESLQRTAQQLASALAAAHQRGIVHRDLKPENIMRSADGHIKVLDFGLARAESESIAASPTITQPGLLVGTPAYMAPEQLTGGAADARSDVFAFGVVIYECATGTHPFGAATPLAAAGRILEAHAPSLATRRADLPPQLATAVDRCLSKAPSDRYPSGVELFASLNVTATAPVPTHSRTWWRVHQTVAIALYLIACIATWQIKEWERVPLTRWVFLSVGAFAALAGILRGHLVFTEATHPRRINPERQRSRTPVLLLDLSMAALLTVDAVLVSSARTVASALVLGLAAGIAIAALFIEPTTATAAFDDDQETQTRS